VGVAEWKASLHLKKKRDISNINVKF